MRILLPAAIMSVALIFVHIDAAPVPVLAVEQVESGTGPAAVAEKKISEKSKKAEAAKSPKNQASMQQVNQARGQLERGRIDAAIHTLEKAVKIDARNGEAFLLLAHAWKMKGEKRKALEFAKKAEILFHKQPEKLREVRSFESDLAHESGEKKKAGGN
jgi:tetratricopeptide (TPR) repeat protein